MSFMDSFTMNKATDILEITSSKRIKLHWLNLVHHHFKNTKRLTDNQKKH